MFKENAYEPLKYYSNNLALENNLVSTLNLFQKGLVSRTTDEKTNRAYFTISEKGFDYIKEVLERAPEIE